VVRIRKGSKGKSAIRFTEGLRARLLPYDADLSDKTLAGLKVGGTNAVFFAGWFYRRIAKVPSLESKVLTALDTGGFGALVELLTVYHLDSIGGYYPMKESEE
jgi:hypothetical protein